MKSKLKCQLNLTKLTKLMVKLKRNVTWTSIHDTVDGSKEDTPTLVVEDDDDAGLKFLLI